jgi:hypothetical protein
MLCAGRGRAGQGYCIFSVYTGRLFVLTCCACVPVCLCSSHSNPKFVQMWKDVFWAKVMQDGNGTRHPVLTAEQYPESRRDDERERMFYYTQEYFEQNKLIAKNIFSMFNLVQPFGLAGNMIDELRMLTHLPQCMCYFCQYQDHKAEIEEDTWESKCPSAALRCSALFCSACLTAVHSLLRVGSEVRLQLAKKGKFHFMSWREKQEIVDSSLERWLWGSVDDEAGAIWVPFDHYYEAL